MQKAAVQKALLSWLSTFKFTPPNVQIPQLTDGKLLYSVLNDIDPLYFPASAYTVSPQDASNWALLQTKVRRMFRSMASYFEAKLNQNIDLLEPNITSMVRDGDGNAWLAFLELIVCLAVQSEKRQVYIGKMQELDEESQHALMFSIESTMNAIQNGLSLVPASSRETSANPSPTPDQSQLDREKVDKMAKEKKDLETKLKNAQDGLEKLKKEQDLIKAENLALQKQLHETEAKLKKTETKSSSEVVLKTEMNVLKQQYEKSELERHELEHHVQTQSAIITELNRKMEELHTKAQETQKLKDKLDEMNFINEKLLKAEAQLEKFKRKADDDSDAKKQIREIDSELQRMQEKYAALEEEYKKVSAFKPMMDSYKTQVVNLESANTQLVAEKQRLNADLSSLKNKYETVEKQRESDGAHIQALEERIQELEFSGGQMPIMGERLGEIQPDPPSISELKLELAKLKKENEELKHTPRGDGEDKSALLQSLLADAEQLKSKYEKQYLEEYQKNSILEKEVADLKQGGDLQKINLDLRERINVIGEESSVLKKRIKELEVEVETARKEVVVAKSNATMISQDQNSVTSNLKGELEKLKQSMKTLVDEKQSLTERINEMLVERDEMQKQQLALKDELLEKERSNPTAMDEEIKKRDQEILKYKDKMEKLVKLLKERTSERSPTSTNLADAYPEALTSLQNSLKEKEVEISRLQKEVKVMEETYRTEQQLIASSWYELAMQLQKHSLVSTRNQSSPRSWLEAQRRNILDSPLKRFK